VWACLRSRGVCTSRKRVLRLTRGAGLLEPTARVRKRAQGLHDGTIAVAAPRARHGRAPGCARTPGQSTTPPSPYMCGRWG
jgi:hypothetical protein